MNEQAEIPHIIHYFWFGGGEKSDLIKKCIASWHQFFPDFEIKEWNEFNYDVNKIPYTSEAYKCKKWAFVSDYARFDILYHYGGVYFDTDVEVLKTFPKELFDEQGFTGMESTNEIAPGLIFACMKGHPFLEKILEDYEKSHFIVEGKEHPITVNKRVGALFEENGFKRRGEIQCINGIRIYPSEWFCGYDLDVFEPDIKECTLSIHHYSSTWEYSSFTRKRKVQVVLKRLVGVNGYRKILKFARWLRKLRGK